MKFSDEGIIVSGKKHGEDSLIVKILSKSHGICNSFIKNSINSKNYAKYQIGNLVFFDLYTKNANSLSYVKTENIESFSSKHILDFPRFNIINLFCLIISKNFMEQDPDSNLFSEFLFFLNSLKEDNRSVVSNIIRFELKLLEMYGYGLDLSICTVTGSKDNLHFISPKSGKAVSYKYGQPYEDKLFCMTNFLKNNLFLDNTITKKDLLDSADIIKFFMKKYGLLTDSIILSRNNTISKL